MEEHIKKLKAMIMEWFDKFYAPDLHPAKKGTAAHGRTSEAIEKLEEVIEKIQALLQESSVREAIEERKKIKKKLS